MQYNFYISLPVETERTLRTSSPPKKGPSRSDRRVNLYIHRLPNHTTISHNSANHNCGCGPRATLEPTSSSFDAFLPLVIGTILLKVCAMCVDVVQAVRKEKQPSSLRSSALGIVVEEGDGFVSLLGNGESPTQPGLPATTAAVLSTPNGSTSHNLPRPPSLTARSRVLGSPALAIP